MATLFSSHPNRNNCPLLILISRRITCTNIEGQKCREALGWSIRDVRHYRLYDSYKQLQEVTTWQTQYAEGYKGVTAVFEVNVKAFYNCALDYSSISLAGLEVIAINLFHQGLNFIVIKFFQTLSNHRIFIIFELFGLQKRIVDTWSTTCENM